MPTRFTSSVQSTVNPELVGGASRASLLAQWTRTRGASLAIDYGVAAALLAVVVYFSLTEPDFMTARNWQAIGMTATVVGLLAVPFTVALVAGQIDLTVGIAVGLTSTLFTITVSRDGHPLWVGVLVMVAGALAIGLVNGALVVDFGINSLIVTFAMSQFLLGLSNALWDFHRTGALSSGEFTAGLAPGKPGWSLVGRANELVLGVPLPVILLALVAVVFSVLLVRTKLGSHIYATGGNPSAALRAGIRTRRVVRFVFLLGPLVAVLAALVTIGRTGSPNPSAGFGLEFDVITAVLIGGAAIAGGTGRIERSLLGVLFVVVIRDGLTLKDFDVAVQYIVVGALFVFAVLLSAVASKQRGR